MPSQRPPQQHVPQPHHVFVQSCNGAYIKSSLNQMIVMKWARAHTHWTVLTNDGSRRTYPVLLMRMPIQHLSMIVVVFFFVLFCVWQVSWYFLFIFSPRWMVHTIHSHIKVSLSLITANHCAYTQQLNFCCCWCWCFFFTFPCPFMWLSSGSHSHTDSSATKVCRCEFAFKLHSNDCFNCNYASMWQHCLYFMSFCTNK